MEPAAGNLYPSMTIGAPVMAPVAAEVVESRRAGIVPGDRVITFGAWEDYSLIKAATSASLIPQWMTFIESLGPYGLNALTGYVGMLRVGDPRPNEVVVVSGAAGSTGSVAAQIAKIRGAMVIGIAGGRNKCHWLIEDCKLDGAIDYKSEVVKDRLDALCPDGIDLFFDNVGGEILDAAIGKMKRFGRIALCGQIAGYDHGGMVKGPRDMMRIIYGSIRLQGFLCSDFASDHANAIEELRRWIDEGRMAHREDVRTGFADIPRTFMSLFDGSNHGTLLAEIE
jgi:NADPH-dependent curcumin reductase CurA